MGSNDPYELEGKVLEGRYSIEAAIAEGGFGVVYRGRHIELQKPIALKVLKVREGVSEKVNATIYEQFVNEARTVARLRHPNIVQALDLGRTSMPSGTKAPWMALEWIEGQTLRQWLSEHAPGPLSVKETLDLLRPAFDAIACAHDNQVAHRDIKPANLMVVEASGRRARQVLVMDFGIAKLMEDGEAAGEADTRTTSEFATYTKRYGAPEQALGRRSGPWTDVHALALIVVEVLTGDTAYRDEQNHADGILGLILDTKRPTPRALGVDVGDWEPVLAKALHRNVSERYRDAGEFLTALETALPGRDPKSPTVPRFTAIKLATDTPAPVTAPTPTPAPAAAGLAATVANFTGMTTNAAVPSKVGVAAYHSPGPGSYPAPQGGSYAQTVVGSVQAALPTVVGPAATPYAAAYPAYRPITDSHTTSAPLTMATSPSARPASTGSPIGGIMAGLGVVILLGGVGYALAVKHGSHPAPMQATTAAQPVRVEPARPMPAAPVVPPPPEIIPPVRPVAEVTPAQPEASEVADAGSPTDATPDASSQHHHHSHTPQQSGFHLRVN